MLSVARLYTTFVRKVLRLSLLKIKALSVKNTLKHVFSELPNIYVSLDIKSVSELYGQRLEI
jgi:hypothetical protein